MYASATAASDLDGVSAGGAIVIVIGGVLFLGFSYREQLRRLLDKSRRRAD